MLNDWPDRDTPVRWKSVLARVEAGLIGALLAAGLLYGIVSEIRAW